MFCPPEQMAAVAVPEAAVHENHHQVFREHQVRFSGQVAAEKPEPVTDAVQRRPDHHFRFRVSAPNPRHHPAAHLGSG